MAKGGRVTLNTKTLDDIRKNIPGNRDGVLVSIAADVEGYYREHAPRDTGSMAEGAYTQLQDKAYREGKQTSASMVQTMVRALNPAAEVVELPKPSNKQTAHVGPIVAHAPPNEFGSRYMAARPTLTNAVARANANLKSKHKAAFVKLVTNGHR